MIYKLLHRDNTDNPPTELRLALVMNGGVSLAVWMGGMSAEIHRAVTCSDYEGNSDEPEIGASPDALWAQLTRATGYKLGVDVVAGTSAGGLNGVLLAACLAQGHDFPDFEDLWGEHASLRSGKLLSSNRKSRVRDSVLDGDFFYKKIFENFYRLATPGPRDGQDVQCLVTATAVDPLPLELRDDAGSRDLIRDSRRVFRFQRRHEYDFDATTCVLQEVARNDFTDPETISVAARSSAGFPLAFAPGHETPALRKLRVKPAPDSGASADGIVLDWLMDGGVLDNAPFEPLLDELRSRPVNGHWKRVVGYIVPTAARRTVEGGKIPQPGLSQVIGGVLNSWREADGRLDLEAIQNYRHDAAVRNDVAIELLGELRQTEADWLSVGREMFPLYRRTRLQAVASVPPPPGFPGNIAYIDAPRPAGIDLPFIPTDIEWAPQEDWSWGVGTAVRLLQWWGRAMNRHPTTEANSQSAIANLGVVQSKAQAVAATATSLHRELVGVNITPDRLRTWAEDVRVVMCFAKLKELVEEGASIYSSSLGSSRLDTAQDDPIGKEIQAGLVVEVLLNAIRWAEDRGEPPELLYTRMGPDIDSAAMSDSLRAHVSAGGRKLYGDSMNHFGAFVDVNWRKSDWKWGRLDAAAHLVRSLARNADWKEEQTMLWTTAIQKSILAETLQGKLSAKQTGDPLKKWHQATSRSLDRDELGNGAVLARLRRNKSSRNNLVHLYNESLRTLTQLGVEQGGQTEQLAYDAIHLLFLGESVSDLPGAGRGKLRGIGGVVRPLIRSALTGQPIVGWGGKYGADRWGGLD